MFIPKDYTEQQVLDIIEKLVNMFARTFKFGYYELDDMKQEGRLFALEVLPSYNPNSGCTLETFLFNAIKNRYINLFRDKCYRVEPPCIQCASYDNPTCLKYEDKTFCKRWVNWLKRNKSKRSLSQASSSEEEIDLEHKDNLLEHIAKRELFKIIDERLPSTYRSDYQRLSAGVNLPANRHKKLLNMLKHILGDYLYEEEENQSDQK